MMRTKKPQILSTIGDDHQLRRTKHEPARGHRGLGHEIHSSEFHVGQIVTGLLSEQRGVGDGFMEDGRGRVAWRAVPKDK